MRTCKQDIGRADGGGDVLMGAETGLRSFEDGEYGQPLEADEAGVSTSAPEGDGPASTVALGREARFTLPTSS